MPIIRTTDLGDMQWDVRLAGNDGAFQWNVRLASIIEGEAGTGAPCHDVLNRDWEAVGPIFKKRSEGARFLGYEGKNENVSTNMDMLIEEYNSLYSDEVQTRRRFHPEDKRKFGRPSEGKSERMQFSATKEMRKWIEDQIKSGENVSQVIYRIVEEKMSNV